MNVTNSTTCNADGFASNPDVAAIGIVVAFLVVSALPCLTSLAYLIVMIRANRKARRGGREYVLKGSHIYEALIMSCSGRQIFTGFAIGIALLTNWSTISAYHYDVVTYMLLMTLATHMVAVGMVKQYWDKWPAAIILTLFIVIVYGFTIYAIAKHYRHAPFPANL